MGVVVQVTLSKSGNLIEWPLAPEQRVPEIR